ncbi:hypothetical protein G9444_4248 [Rhodococcus erythropolis]|uniref:Nuclease SbcCD subunit C n=1 Tax=Rhodococcus erythropolis TaxID=1833 RepID=A0A6G9CXB3_RHOER|nr:AAA family ATPase [Rhodococcus erythropolis]QIP41492.1 hypothetical protein G9444_4248 [Rhodococcus erythropolis]
MILDKLVLQNIGTFAGRHSIDLAPRSSNKPIILVGGLNGAGKTTFLESIHLALYGTLAQLNGRRTGSYENYLGGLIHRGTPASSSSSVELTFRAHQQGNEHTYRIARSWGEPQGPFANGWRSKLMVELIKRSRRRGLSMSRRSYLVG